MDGRTSLREREQPAASLVFPTYNPGAALDRTWGEVERFLARDAGSWEVVFVCDGCTDGTPERLRKLAGGDPRVRVLSYTPNRGKGYAVRQGLQAARGEWRLFTDVDLAYSFEDVLRVTAALRSGADVAIGSRLHPDSRLLVPANLQGYAYRRHLQSLVFSALVRRLLPLRQRDTQAGLKGIRAAAARLVLPALRCEGFGFDCELLLACAGRGLHIAEVPVSVRFDDKASTTSFRAMARMIRELWRIRGSWRHGPLWESLREKRAELPDEPGRKVA
jgi:dolichyl-phosphate beta-glucosyltransferase